MMDLREEDTRRNTFRSILRDLASSQTFLKDAKDRANIYQRLEEVYYIEGTPQRFRHFYSDIFSVLIEVKDSPDLGNIEILAQNLALIRAGYQALNKTQAGDIIDISDSIKKLYDHVNLEAARINYSDKNDWALSQGQVLSEVRAEVNELRYDVEHEKTHLSSEVKELNEVKENLAGMQKDYITILGIFASIVLAFTAGIAFSTSVLENLHAVSIYRIICISLIIGVVLNNTFFGLFYYIERLVRNKDKPILKPYIVANLVLIFLLGINAICWFCGTVERRNDRINDHDNTAVTVTIESTNCSETFPIETTVLP